MQVGLTHIAYLPSVGVPSVKVDLQLGRKFIFLFLKPTDVF